MPSRNSPHRITGRLLDMHTLSETERLFPMTLVPVDIPYEEDDEDDGTSVHADGGSFCSDPTCPCHEDPDLISELAEDVKNGLLEPDEATDIVSGHYHTS
jgi:hypothetical protein